MAVLRLQTLYIVYTVQAKLAAVTKNKFHKRNGLDK